MASLLHVACRKEDTTPKTGDFSLSLFATRYAGGGGKSNDHIATVTRPSPCPRFSVDVRTSSWDCAADVPSSPTAVQASNFLSGNDLFKACTEKSVNRGVCRGYIIGIIDVVGSAPFSSQRTLCVPDSVLASQVEDIVENWPRDHPENRHYAASGLVLAALQEKFPCN
jgi:hypothetical protein